VPTIQLEAEGVLLSLTSIVPTQITYSQLLYGEKIAISFRRRPRALTTARKSVLGERSQLTRDSRRLLSVIHRRLLRNEKPATDHKGRPMKRAYLPLMGILSISGCIPSGPHMTLMVNPKTGERIECRAATDPQGYSSHRSLEAYELYPAI
jgi:hypothetical protein